METKIRKLNENVVSDDKTKKEQFEKKLSKGIALSVEIESNFKLLSYRIINQEIFLSKIDELVKFYKSK